MDYNMQEYLSIVYAYIATINSDINKFNEYAKNN